MLLVGGDAAEDEVVHDLESSVVKKGHVACRPFMKVVVPSNTTCRPGRSQEPQAETYVPLTGIQACIP